MSAALNEWFPLQSESGPVSPYHDRMLRMEVRSLREWDQTAAIWSELANTSPTCSFFLDRDWVESWLETFGQDLRPSILLFEYDSQPVGICLLVRTWVVRGFIPLRRYSLNTSGESQEDTCYAEYNDVLCRPGFEQLISRRLAAYLKDLPWDELVLPAFSVTDFYEHLKGSMTRLDLEEILHPSYYVSLSDLREKGLSFQAALGSKQRKHLRQNLRNYSEQGPLELELAEDVASAQRLLSELADLSQKRWTEMGRKAMFASARFRAFNQKLVERCVPKGVVHLMRVSAGGNTIGIVCNLVHRDRVYFYQCGYNYGSDTRLSPGTVTLSLVIEHYLKTGLDQFDFLSGDAPYKRWLSTDYRSLSWSTFRRSGLRMAAFQGMRRMRSGVLKSLNARRSAE